MDNNDDYVSEEESGENLLWTLKKPRASQNKATVDV